MSTPFDVHVSSGKLSAFKRRAIAHYKKTCGEYIEILFIHRAITEYHIKSFERIKITKSDWDCVEYCPKDWKRLKTRAAVLGLEIGTIHTHPSLHGTQPSKEDYTSIDGDVLIGVCEINDPGYTPCKHCTPLDKEAKKKAITTNIDFWVPQNPCSVIQVKR